MRIVWNQIHGRIQNFENLIRENERDEVCSGNKMSILPIGNFIEKNFPKQRCYVRILIRTGLLTKKAVKLWNYL